MEFLFNKFLSLQACNFIKEKLREANQWISFNMVGTSVMKELIIRNHWDGSISQIWIKPNDSIFTTTQLFSIFQKAYLSSIVSNSFWRSTDIIPINSFHTTSLFLYPLKTSGKPELLWCFQRVQKETSGMKWVNKPLSKTFKILSFKNERHKLVEWLILKLDQHKIKCIIRLSIGYGQFLSKIFETKGKRTKLLKGNFTIYNDFQRNLL